MIWNLRYCFGASLLVTYLASTASSTTNFSFDEIQYWIGEGANRAAMVVDWDSASSADESLVWGFRWDGIAYGEDMFRAILEADRYFYAKLSPPGSFGTAVYGLGFDRNYDCDLNLSDATHFNEHGLNISDAPDQPPPAAISLDPKDYYEEGWFTGFWHYGLSSGNPFDGGAWVSSQLGMSSRVLADGDWDGWTMTRELPDFSDPNFVALPAFAENPIATVVPHTADFDCDSMVAGVDFLAWQQGFGSLSGAQLEDGDATGDGSVDASDLSRWQIEYGRVHSPPSSTLTATFAVVPEPGSNVLILGLLFIQLNLRQGLFL